MNSELAHLDARDLKRTLEQLPEAERYAELMRRKARGEIIPRQFRFFVASYEWTALRLPDEAHTFRITEGDFAGHRRWMEMMKQRSKRGGCATILPFTKNLKDKEGS